VTFPHIIAWIGSSLYFSPFNLRPLLMVISTGLRIYSHSFIGSISQPIYLLNFLLLPSLCC
jgi:hypothetical protein